MKTRQLVTLFALACVLLVPLAAAADSHEQPKPLTWLSYVKAQTGKGNQLGQYIAKNGAEIYDQMMADGEVVTWGVAQPINHNPGDEWTHMEWVTFTGWAAVDKFIQGFMMKQMAKGAEQLMAEQEEWYSLVVPGSHFDAIVRHLVLHPSADGPRPAYFNLAFHSVKPGQAGAAQELFEEYGVPALSGVQSAGEIGGFGLAGKEVHDTGAWSHVFWYAMPSLSSRAAVSAAFDAAAEERGEEAQAEVMKKFAAAFDFDAHHDRIMVVTHYGGGDGGEGGGSE